MYYIIRLSAPNMFLKREILDWRVIYTLVTDYLQATEFSNIEVMSITLIMSNEFMYIDKQTHLNNINQ